MVYPDKNVIRLSEQVVPLKLDVDKKAVEPIATRYKVSLYPTILLLDATGKIVGKVEYTEDPAKFAADLNKVIKGYKPGSTLAGGSSRHRRK